MEERITKTNYVKVTNRNNGVTGYTLNSGIRRQFNIGETKKISLDELIELGQDPGGEVLLKNYLIVQDVNVLDELNIETEPEYYYTEAEIKVLLESGTLDQLEDCLNFAPMGVIDLVKDLAVKLEIPDVRKRKMIFNKTGFNVDNAIMVNTVLEEETPIVTEEKDKRKAAPIEVKKEEAPQRKSKYNVISRKE